MSNIKYIFSILIFTFLSCNSEMNNNTSKEYILEINNWHNKRIENLKKENGWLNLVGLYWLNEGENTFGSDKSNDIVFPEGKADGFLGTITKEDSIIITVINPTTEVYYNGESVKKIEMKADVTGDKTILKHKSLRWFIIKRGEKYGIRLRDLGADLVRDFEGIDRFDVDESWKISANFKKYAEPKKIEIPTILGTIEEDVSPGELQFILNGNEYTLLPTSAGKGLFIIFADLTSGEETYGAGRFLYVDAPDSNNNVIIDFNKAYNPPCAFTKYATCPLPPDENKLRVRIEAGEKNYGLNH